MGAYGSQIRYHPMTSNSMLLALITVNVPTVSDWSAIPHDLNQEAYSTIHGVKWSYFKPLMLKERYYAVIRGYESSSILAKHLESSRPVWSDIVRHIKLRSEYRTSLYKHTYNQKHTP